MDIESTREGFISKISDQLVRVQILKTLEGKRNIIPISEDPWRNVFDRIEQKGSNETIFTFLGNEFPDTPENRLKVATAYTRSINFSLTSMDWLKKSDQPLPTDITELDGAIYELAHVFYRTDLLFEGGKVRTNVGSAAGLEDSNSLFRHLVRAGKLAEILYKDVDPKKLGGEVKLEQMAGAVLGAVFHDWGRLFSNDLYSHEVLEKEFFTNLRINQQIVRSIHEAVPREGVFTSEDASKYDSLPQALVRICDLFGKVNSSGNLRDNVREVLKYSYNRQMSYAERGDKPYRNIPENYEAEVRSYCDRELMVLDVAIQKMSTVGVDVLQRIKEVNEHPEIVQGFFSNLVLG